MKFRFLPLLVAALLLAAFAAHAQTDGATTGGSTAAKKDALNLNDKQLVKSASEAQIAVTHLTEVGKGGPASESVKDLSKRVMDDVNTSWGELGTLAQAKGGEMVKTDKTPGEKRNLDELSKTKAEKFDKTYLKTLERETKRLAAVSVSGSKTASDADLKAFFAKWQPKFTEFGEEATKAGNEAGKAKK